MFGFGLGLIITGLCILGWIWLNRDGGERMTQTCPRRMNELGPWEYEDNLDHWKKRGEYLCCSFCGSLHPNAFMILVETGAAELGPTDKTYKVYVDVPPKDNYKFYFQHLSEEQKKRFIELMNERPCKVKIGYPGRFYVLPFFVEEVNNGREATN